MYIFVNNSTMKKVFTIAFFLLLSARMMMAASPILVEAESFAGKGGWAIDNQSMTVMGSPYLLAHGLGRPVEDAVTTFDVRKAGEYHLWVRTRDWCSTWGRTESPGRFSVIVNGDAVDVEFGTEGVEWHWQDGGVVILEKGKNSLALHDLTGFEGRCDAICFTSRDAAAPIARPSVRKGRPVRKVGYDLVVVGGGIAGCCAAISAAKNGCKVALVQNRPLLGGNNSSEVRVGLSGLIYKDPYPKLGSLLDEIGGIGHWTRYEAMQDTTTERSKHILEVLREHPEKMIHNAGPASNYEDAKKLDAVMSCPGIDLFLNTQIVQTRKRGSRIVSVKGVDIEDGHETIIRGRLFADCTGDAVLGFLAGADYRMGRESREETGESLAPEKADSLVMGTSVQWYSKENGSVQSFPECPWALQFNEENCIPIKHADWDWEAGLDRNQITEIEYIRDHALRAVYGNWDFLKNRYSRKDEFANSSLEWVAYIGGKRESRRLMGDIILNEHDLVNAVRYEDATFTTTWSIDLHYPLPTNGVEGEPFKAESRSKGITPYAVPYRCLYSRNVGNLFMAGRDISVTHVALGTVRVMRTGGMMGEVVGMAAGICKKHSAYPRDVYEDYLEELKQLMSEGL